MLKYERLCEKIYGMLAGFGFEIKMFDEKGDIQIDPAISTRFMVSEPRLIIHVDIKNMSVTLSISTEDSYKSTKKLQNRLKSLCNEFLMNYTIKNHIKTNVTRQDEIDAKIKKYKDLNKEQNQASEISESVMYGKKRTSYQDFGDYRVKVLHSDDVCTEVRGSRSRKIRRLYVESKDKKTKIELPYTNLQCARALASHLMRNGSSDDAVSEYIINSARNLKVIKEFANICKSLSNSDISHAMNVIKESTNRIKSDMISLQSINKYSIVEEKINIINMLDEDIDDSLYNSLSVIEESGIFGDIPSIMKKIIKEQNSTCSIATYELTSSSYMCNAIKSTSAMVFESSKMLMMHIIEEAERVCKFNETKKVLCDIKQKIDEGTKLTEYEKASIKALINQNTSLTI